MQYRRVDTRTLDRQKEFWVKSPRGPRALLCDNLICFQAQFQLINATLKSWLVFLSCGSILVWTSIKLMQHQDLLQLEIAAHNVSSDVEFVCPNATAPTCCDDAPTCLNAYGGHLRTVCANWWHWGPDLVTARTSSADEVASSCKHASRPQSLGPTYPHAWCLQRAAAETVATLAGVAQRTTVVRTLSRAPK